MQKNYGKKHGSEAGNLWYDVRFDYLDARQSRHLETKKILEDKIGLNNVVLSGITQMELMLGAQNKQDLVKIKKSISRFIIILVNEDINTKASSLIEKYALSHGLELPDSLNAATSILPSLELFTYNIKDYKFISELSLFKS